MSYLHPNRAVALLLCLAIGCGGVHAGGHGTTPRFGDDGGGPSVAWRDAGPEAFEAAARQGRLVLLSVQAEWCHFCHVMNDTTYRDPAIVALLGERFVTVRAEADARPDLAERYGAWGWPATIVLTADGQEIAALRGFRDARALRTALERALADPRPRDVFAVGPDRPAYPGLEAAIEAATTQLDATYDPREEGWGTPQKYPFTAPVLFALTRPAPWPGRAERTLERYTRLIDPVWGGMYQYSEQGDWAHPHYERIASIQAGALEAFAELARASGDAGWLVPAREVLRFVRDFLRRPDGGLLTSMDADLRVPGREPLPGMSYFALDDAARRALGVPRIDPNVYASTDGVLAAGLARYAAACPREDPTRTEALAMAEAAVAFSDAHHLDRAVGLYRHATVDPPGRYHLADQVAMLRAFLALQHVSGDRALAERARALADAIEAMFCDATRGCVTLAPDDGPLGARVAIEETGRLAQGLVAVADLANDRGYEERARGYLERAATPRAIQAAGRILGDFLLGAFLATHERPIAHVVGPPDDPRTIALFDAALRAADLRTRVELAAPSEGRYPYRGEPSLFACSLSACAAPVTDPDAVRGALAQLGP
ncbi:MAG: hypothetical protein OHK0013_44430 [Sandaracinaceae bacterium]